jgi:hypothetical protein
VPDQPDVTEQGRAATIDPRIVEAAAGAGLVGAPTTVSDDAWSWPRRPAAALARAIGARLILGDVSTRSAWTTPYGTGGVGADRVPPYSDGTTAVSKQELALLGHEKLIQQLSDAEDAGVDAAVWLADRPGILALDRFLELFPIDVLVVPPLHHPSLGDRLRGDDLAAIRRRMGQRLLLVANEDGSLTIDSG